MAKLTKIHRCNCYLKSQKCDKHSMFGGISIRLYLGGKVDRPYIRVVGVLDLNRQSRGRMPLALQIGILALLAIPKGGH